MQGCSFFLTSAFTFIGVKYFPPFHGGKLWFCLIRFSWTLLTSWSDLFHINSSYSVQSKIKPQSHLSSFCSSGFISGSGLIIGLRGQAWVWGGTCYYIALPTFLLPLVSWAGEEGDEKRRGR